MHENNDNLCECLPCEIRRSDDEPRLTKRGEYVVITFMVALVLLVAYVEAM